jgi:ribonucleoside-diphosphate reductase alpha chain
MGLKGITYMRDGSRQGVLERVDDKKEEKKEVVAALATVPIHRPHVLSGRTYEVMTPLGKAFITVNRDEQGLPMEVFANIGKAGMQTSADSEAIGRLLSIALKSAGSANRREVAQKIVSQLRGIGGSSHIGFGKERVMSLPDAIAKVIAEDLALSENSQNQTENLPLAINADAERSTNGHAGAEQLAMLAAPEQATSKSGDMCPECGNATFVYEEGCKKCYSCGYSVC